LRRKKDMEGGILAAWYVGYVYDVCFPEGENERAKGEIAKGVSERHRFVPSSVVEHETAIRDMLGELPDVFQTDKGAPLVAAMCDCYGRRWADERGVRRLVALALAADLIEITAQSEGHLDFRIKLGC
jgi:hypothetical protein